MPLSLNGSTIMTTPQAEEIRATASAGFPLLELRAPKLRDYLANHSMEELRGLLSNHRLRVLSINSLEKATMRPDAEWPQVEQECRELAALAGSMGCPFLLVIPGPTPVGASPAAVKRETVAQLRLIADLASLRGVRIGFEFLGFSWCSVRTLEQAADIVAEVARPDVGLVIDTCHFYASGSALEVLDALDASKLFIVHVNDCPQMPRDQIHDADRVMPGDGVIPLRDIWSRLLARGYDGPASVELFHPGYWERNPVEVAERAHRAAAALFESNVRASHGS